MEWLVKTVSDGGWRCWVASLEVNGEGRSAETGMTLAAGAPLDVAASAANPADGGGFVRAGRELAALPCPAFRLGNREARMAVHFYQAQS
ncbi:hypothetical protein GCM10011505_07070 [Tistrella bauzanensis]|uniref:Uncharacterized protein n=2 Tax=Tistrella bauzanensis TaxID=657419 RepID=A0ABQ1IAY3_9PROT|nr:hypothetical protein GCM10011505_07070 [Tistrella bauzanensis]